MFKINEIIPQRKFVPVACRGMVLLITLMMLMIISLLTISALQINLLDLKIGENYLTRELALHDAENNLLVKESVLLRTNQLVDGVVKISTAVCGVTFYRVLATGAGQNIVISLQSTVAIVGDISRCNPKPVIRTGRQSWLEV